MAIETPDPCTAMVKLKNPFGPFLFMTSENSGPILLRHLLQGQDVAKAEFNRKPVGTGPFRIAEIEQSDAFTRTLAEFLEGVGP